MPRLQLKGANLTPRRENFDAIEVASRDEIAALQPGTVERSLGKAKRVIDLRSKDRRSPERPTAFCECGP